MKEKPACIVASSVKAGTEYAKVLGVENYIIRTNRNLPRSRGRQFRCVVITPGYHYAAVDQFFDNLRVLDDSIIEIDIDSDRTDG